MNLNIQYHENQNKIFYGSDARFKIIAKGRRFGLTRGFAHYVIEQMMDGISPLLWVDTTNPNIDRYVERYFFPILNQIPKEYWRWRKLKKELQIFNSVCDFRSADRPENLEGFGYRKIIINEAGIVLKDRYLWNNAIRPMAMDYKADVLIGGTPKGKRVKKEKEDCLFAQLFKRGEEDKKVWQSFRFSSYDNAFLDPAEVDEMVKEVSSAVRRQEIFGEFIDAAENEIIKREWWRYYKELPKRFINVVQSWDTAFKKKEENDYSVCTTWGETESGYFLLDFWRERVEYPELRRQVLAQYEKSRPYEILIEDKASGQSLIQDLQRETKLPIKPIKVDTDKIARVNAVTPTIEAGNVYLPENAPWLADFINECSDFPSGEHDDVPDSLSQALNYLRSKQSGPLEITTMARDSFNLLKGF